MSKTGTWKIKFESYYMYFFSFLFLPSNKNDILSMYNRLQLNFLCTSHALITNVYVILKYLWYHKHKLGFIPIRCLGTSIQEVKKYSLAPRGNLNIVFSRESLIVICIWIKEPTLFFLNMIKWHTACIIFWINIQLLTGYEGNICLIVPQGINIAKGRRQDSEHKYVS